MLYSVFQFVESTHGQSLEDSFCMVEQNFNTQVKGRLGKAGEDYEESLMSLSETK